MSDRSVLKDLQASYVASNPTASISNPVTAVAAQNYRAYTWVKTAIDTNATDNTAEFAVTAPLNAGKLVAATYTAIANVASAANNTIQLTVSKRLAADPANAIVVANALTNASPLVAWTPYAITVNTQASQFAANSVATFKILKANSGTALAAGVLTLTFEEV